MRNADDLLKLKQGWDSYDAGPCDPPTVEMAKRIGEALSSLIPSYDPEYVPCGDGSVQVEWHAGGWDLEVWVQRVGSQETGEQR